MDDKLAKMVIIFIISALGLVILGIVMPLAISIWHDVLTKGHI